MLNDERKDELAKFFMESRKDHYQESFRLSPYENLKEHLYRQGLFTLGHDMPKMIRDFAHESHISLIEAGDFFHKILEDLFVRVLKEIRSRRDHHES